MSEDPDEYVAYFERLTEALAGKTIVRVCRAHIPECLKIKCTNGTTYVVGVHPTIGPPYHR